MSKRTKIIIGLIILIWFIWGTFLPSQRKENQSMQKDPYEVSKIETFKSQFFNNSVITHGVVKPFRAQRVILGENKKVEKVFVKNGDKVKKGQIIALLGTFNERKNAINILRQEKNRLYYESRRLDNEIKNNKPALYPSNLDSLIQSAKKAEYYASQFIVVAEFDGYVVNINLQENTHAPEYNNKIINPVIEIVDNSSFFVDLEISDSYISKISPKFSQAIAITPDNEIINCKIIFSNYKIDEITGAFDLRVEIPKNKSIIPGSSIKVEITTIPVRAYSIPSSSITTDEKGYPIVKIIDNKEVKNYYVDILQEEKKLNKTWINASGSNINIITVGSSLFTEGQKADIEKFKNNKKAI